MEAALANDANGANTNGAGVADSPAILASVDMEHSLEKDDYREKLDKYQSRVVHRHRNTVIDRVGR